MAPRSAAGALLALVLAVTVLAPAALSLTADVPTAVVPSLDFHAVSCPHLEGIVRYSVKAALQKEIALAAGILRIFFHDCFPQGCDASILLKKQVNNVTSELDLGPNKTIQPRALQLIEDIRAKVHAACGPTVSCTDITALVTRDVVVLSGGPSFDVLQGKLDSFTPASQNDVFSLPQANSNVTVLLEAFGPKGLGDPADLVALSGGHTIGRAECTSFADRAALKDDTFSRKLAANCSKHPNRLQNLDVITPDLFDNGYYKALTFNQGVFLSDMALIKDGKTKSIVRKFAENKEAFFAQFAKSMVKLSNAPRPGGNDGEIRCNCFSSNGNHIIETVDGDDEGGFAASA